MNPSHEYIVSSPVRTVHLQNVRCEIRIRATGAPRLQGVRTQKCTRKVLCSLDGFDVKKISENRIMLLSDRLSRSLMRSAKCSTIAGAVFLSLIQVLGIENWRAIICIESIEGAYSLNACICVSSLPHRRNNQTTIV